MYRLGESASLHIRQRETLEMSGELRMPHGFQEVLEFHRTQMQVLNASHGHGKPRIGKRELHQRTRRDDM